MENVLLPLCIISIIEKETKIKFNPLFNKIIWIENTYDENYLKMDRSNNNLFDIEGYLNEYKGDTLRLYFLNNNLNMDFIFEEKELTTYKDLLEKIEEYFQKDFVHINNSIDYELFRLYKDCLEEINDKNIFNYVNKLVEFFNDRLIYEDITKKQALLFLKLLYPIIPFTTEDIYENIFKAKYLISYDGINI